MPVDVGDPDLSPEELHLLRGLYVLSGGVSGESVHRDDLIAWCLRHTPNQAIAEVERVKAEKRLRTN